VYVCVCVCPANSVYNNIFLLLYPCLRFSDLRNNVLQLGDSRFEPLERVRYTRDQLLEMREIVDIAKEILKLQQDFSVVLLGEEHQDQSWLHNDSNVRTLPLLFRWQLWLLPSYCSSFLQCCKVLLQ
jgi:hypothetical protein